MQFPSIRLPFPLPVCGHLAAFTGAVLLCIGVQRPVRAQNFNAFDSNQVQLVSGYTFQANGVNVTSSSQIGPSGTYVFGFAVGNTPITVKFLQNSADFGINAGQTDTFTAIEDFGLISSSGVSATLGTSSAITAYNKVSAGNWSPGSYGAGPNYKAGNFGSSNFLRGGSEYTGVANAQSGSFNFSGVASNSTIYAGGHWRDSNGKTGHILIKGFAATTNVTPEGGSLALLAGGLIPLLPLARRCRTRREAI